MLSLFAFIVVILILVGVHEFGHFWVAKKCDVKVLKFSIGFGPVIKKWQKGETEFVLSAIPLGGFVKMLDKREGEVADEENHREFNQKSVYQRFAIVIAGPLANLLFAIFLLIIVNFVGIQQLKPIIGSVIPNTPAFVAGLKDNDRIISINNHKITGVSNVLSEIINNIDEKSISIEVKKDNSLIFNYQLFLPKGLFKNPKEDVFKILGFNFALPTLPPVINKIVAKSPAEVAGILVGDEIIKINQTEVKSWKYFVEIIQQNPNKLLKVLIKRNNKIININLTPDSEAKVGVQVFVPKGFLDDYFVIEKKSFFDAIQSAVLRTYNLSITTLKFIGKMIMGNASIEHISGPVSIANYAGQSFNLGFVAFLSFLAMISISLGVLNLLPIPMLDGGHLLFYFIEIIKGSPVNDVFQILFQKVGLLFILSLMTIAVYNDVLLFIK
ncbi:Membrane-associated zinc metalloprotease [hydrothermal vent metagenome]|uniref:Membrane-associated zinc metalloprotease n=1 Tax=hydrothermal vent metagenome TaxID=652676 RepID=A0A1W1BFG1_9ZZZZ